VFAHITQVTQVTLVTCERKTTMYTVKKIICKKDTLY
jgi:hypothetical protein